jgi:hypothetical protein
MRVKGEAMSFQAYLDNIEEKTGKTPREFVAFAEAKGFGADTKAGEILDWLKTDFDLGRGHGMALVHVIRNGRAARGEPDALWLDGKASKPN